MKQAVHLSAAHDVFSGRLSVLLRMRSFSVNESVGIKIRSEKYWKTAASPKP
jgi:hypothetical protein